MKRLTLCLFVLPLALPALARADEPKEAKGVWVPTEMTVAGQALPAEQLSALKLTIGDGKYKAEVNNEGTDSGTYTIDSTKKPGRLEITSTDGANKGKKMLAIWELSGDTMKVCYDLEGKDYPTEFKSTKENKYLLAVYKKQK
ncbi:MAG TPA: TIGR03067 domain-containing protein [Gemmataceae bacterium]|nr:TIGR03067 domain-containing protein [Gemmataceae bacterium]